MYKNECSKTITFNLQPHLSIWIIDLCFNNVVYYHKNIENAASILATIQIIINKHYENELIICIGTIDTSINNTLFKLIGY